MAEALIHSLGRRQNWGGYPILDISSAAGTRNCMHANIIMIYGNLSLSWGASRRQSRGGLRGPCRFPVFATCPVVILAHSQTIADQREKKDRRCDVHWSEKKVWPGTFVRDK